MRADATATLRSGSRGLGCQASGVLRGTALDVDDVVSVDVEVPFAAAALFAAAEQHDWVDVWLFRDVRAAT